MVEHARVDPQALTVEFNEHINRQDVDGLAALMTDDHAFIDTAGHAVHGKSACLEAWREFFKLFPDYRNVFDRLIVQDNRVVVVGRSTCSDRRLNGPALWASTARDGRLAEWRVYEDTPNNRRVLGIPASGV
jgi:ketosteroid isomerase-like protein